jgi:hypothetical protein
MRLKRPGWNKQKYPKTTNLASSPHDGKVERIAHVYVIGNH